MAVVTRGVMMGCEGRDFLYRGAPPLIAWARRSKPGVVELGLGVID